MGDNPDDDHRSLEQDRSSQYPSPGLRQYPEGYPVTQPYYPPHYASPPQHTSSRHFQPQVYPQSMSPYAPNYQPSPFPGVPPMTYYYPFSPTPPAGPRFGYPDANIPVNQPRDTVYSGSRPSPSMNLPPQRSTRPSLSMASSNMYSHVVYPPPGPYQYATNQSLPASSPSSQYPNPPHFPGAPGSESWYYGPALSTEYEQHSTYPLQRPFSAHTAEPQQAAYVSSPSHIPHNQPYYSETSYPTSSSLSLSPNRPLQGFPPTLSATTDQSTRSRQKPQGNRRPYQPNAPANRSEWVMWVGNIPSDCSQDELLRFFQSVPPSSSPSTPLSTPSSELHGGTEDHGKSGILSIFLISQSNCAFVNYDFEASLHHAVATFNGRSLRPDDPRCLPLVCRVRNRDEDFRAGVGAQRGLGMHAKWVQEQKARARQSAADQDGQAGTLSEGNLDNEGGGSSPERRTPSMSSGQSPSSGGHPASQSPATARLHDGSSGSVSFASTNSSLLANYFPQRYFILKSLTQVTVFIYRFYPRYFILIFFSELARPQSKRRAEALGDTTS